VATEVWLSIIGAVVGIGTGFSAAVRYIMNRLQHYQEGVEHALDDCKKQHAECDERARVQGEVLTEQKVKLASIETRLNLLTQGNGR
jgi:hypothetical protein